MKTLSLQERVVWLAHCDIKENDPELAEMITYSELSSLNAVVEFKTLLREWHPKVVITDDWVHNRLDKLDIPREVPVDDV